MAAPASSVYESKGFFIFMVIVVGFITGILIACTIYFSRLEHEPNQAIGSSAASFMKWVCGIFALLAGIVFIWALVRLFVADSARAAIAASLAAPPSGLITYNPAAVRAAAAGIGAAGLPTLPAAQAALPVAQGVFG